MGEMGEVVDAEGAILELEQEKEMKEMLELSVFEMKNTVAQLEKRLTSVEDEDNEWKTRYETQIELNRQLERQIGLLQGKMEQIRGSPTDRLASIRTFDQMHMFSRCLELQFLLPPSPPLLEWLQLKRIVIQTTWMQERKAIIRKMFRYHGDEHIGVIMEYFMIMKMLG
ncbi:coiled-coil domain-containing protein 169 isoform X2 [Sceloporus undulatus]|uniref:coiled-coil domain-containing protein 169 isoform X2 n=1 Tax=Sceloporus undulatus TaxID=8520 RepID=UPI001C4DA46E|nr:coiled-coil domain-containing protein 169 isoform X2 [Sceloporus undulatus]